MRVLVTGGSGYIGGGVLAALCAQPDVDEVIDVDLRPPRAAPPQVRFVARSVTDDLRDLFAGVDLALHLAWVLDPLEDAARQRAVCIGGTERFLEACAQGGVPRVFFMSSISAYGANPAHARPVDESEPLKERWHFQYSAEKREAEGLVARFAAERPQALVQIARPCTVGGPNVSNFIFRALDRPLTLRPAGRDVPLQLVHEDDAAAAIAAIAASRVPGAFNVVADGTLTLREGHRRLGVRALPLPLPLLHAVTRLAWRRRWRRLFEAPPEFLHFVTWPCLGSNRRLKAELGVSFRHDAAGTLDAYLGARARRR
jgi:nucleoside-diphosphate-sugar epimerase